MTSQSSFRSLRRPLLHTVGWLLLAITVAWFGPMASAQVQAEVRPAMPALFLEDTSPKALVPTTQAFREAVAAAGWSMLGVTNMAGVLSERGFTVHPALIFEPCSGKYSAALLGKDETRFVTSMIPCRVAIYQTSTGKVVISRMNSVAIADMVGGPAGEVIRQSGEEMEQIIKATLKKLGR